MSVPHPSHLGPYEIVGFVGAGGMGEVYRARDRRLSREVAVKVLPKDVLRDSDGFARFVEEARAASALNHPGIVTIHDYGEEDGQPYIVMELIEGESLRQRLVYGPVSSRETAALGAQIAEALAAAHEKGIVHRDLKPANVVVTPEGRAKVLDFGLARRSPPRTSRPEDTVATRMKETAAGLVVGTVDYMSPEQVRGDAVDGRSDIFALGTVLFELLSGRPPFSRATPADTMVAVLTDDPPDLAGSIPAVAPGLERLVRRCLEKTPALRFQSARDVAFALEAVGAASVPRTTAAERPVVPSRRRGRVAVVAGAVAGGPRAGRGPSRRGLAGGPRGCSGRASRDDPPHLLAREHPLRPLRAGREDGRLRSRLGRRPDPPLRRAAGKPRAAAGRAARRGRPLGLAVGRDGPLRRSQLSVALRRLGDPRAGTDRRTRPARHPRGGPRGRLGPRRRDAGRRERRRREDAARDADRQGPLRDGWMGLAPSRVARRIARRLRPSPAPLGRPGLGDGRPRAGSRLSRWAGPGRASAGSRGLPRERRSGTRRRRRGPAGSCVPSTSRAATVLSCASRGT